MKRKGKKQTTIRRKPVIDYVLQKDHEDIPEGWVDFDVEQNLEAAKHLKHALSRLYRGSKFRIAKRWRRDTLVIL